LLDYEALGTVNRTQIAAVCDNAIKLLWEGGVRGDNILLFVTGVAPNMVKAASGLQAVYPRVVHLTCLPLHRVIAEIRETYPDIDKLVSDVKKMFVKA
jgi:hypothetical protein